MNELNIGTAFLAGILSFLSPCVLPLIPGYISFISGLSLEELSTESALEIGVTKKAGWNALFFVAGFSLVFTLLGASATWAGQFLANYLNLFTKIAGIVIILFGLHTAGIVPIPWLYYEKRFQLSQLPSGILASFAMGLAFAFGWTPCIGPILSGILALAATQETIFRGTFLLFIYSLGLGIPFILTAFGIRKFLLFFSRYKKFIRYGEIFSGILLIFIGGLIFFSKLTLLINFLPKQLFKLSF